MLRKPGKLDDDELAQIREHPRSAPASCSSSRPSAALFDVLYHHERWDETGYPTGRAGEAIPEEARVLAVADAFDAMTSDRPYRPALSGEEALAEVQRCSGTQFDPSISGIFLELSAETDTLAAAAAV